MARYLWEYGNYKRSMIIGSFGSTLTADNVYGTNYVTVDGVQYTVMRGSFPYNYETDHAGQFTLPAPTWSTAAGDQFGGFQNFTTWKSGNAFLEIVSATTGNTKYVYVSSPRVGSTTLAEWTAGNGTGYNMAIYAMAGVLNGVRGVLFTYRYTEQPPPSISDGTLAYSSFIFLSDNFFNVAEPENPYDPAGTESAGGTPNGGYGGGSANGGGSSAPNSTAPTHPIAQGAGIHYMLVNKAQLADFSDKMWGRGEGIFDTLWSKWKGYKFNPMAGILTCHALPTAFYPAVSGAGSSISVAGTSIPVSCTQVNAGIVQVSYSQSLGDILQYSNFLDYQAIRIIAHIPFCGICEIPAAACIGGSLTFTFRCDVLTGNVACWIMAYDRFGNEHQINCLTGNCAYTVPITGNDNGMSAIIGALTNNATSLVSSGANALAGLGTRSPQNVSASLAGSSVSNDLRIITAQRHTQIAGNVSGSAAIVANMHLFLDITYANPSYPSTMLSVRGTPSDVGGSVSNFSGCYVEFSDVHADGINFATDTEKREIERMLKEGVYV